MVEDKHINYYVRKDHNSEDGQFSFFFFFKIIDFRVIITRAKSHYMIISYVIVGKLLGIYHEENSPFSGFMSMPFL